MRMSEKERTLNRRCMQQFGPRRASDAVGADGAVPIAGK